MCLVARQYAVTTSASTPLLFSSYKSKLQHGLVLSATNPLHLNTCRSISQWVLTNKSVLQLKMDSRYVADILKSTPKSVDQVTIEPNGHWSQALGAAPSPTLTNGHTRSDWDDDLVEIQDLPRVASVKTEITREPGLMRTPPISSREQSASSLTLPLSNKKRSVGHIVDLTLSSDEDDEPPRGPKRQIIHKSSSGFPKIPSLESVPLRTNVDVASSGFPRQQQSSNSFASSDTTPKEYGRPP